MGEAALALLEESREGGSRVVEERVAGRELRQQLSHVILQHFAEAGIGCPHALVQPVPGQIEFDLVCVKLDPAAHVLLVDRAVELWRMRETDRRES
jgi:hypothetical protein